MDDFKPRTAHGAQWYVEHHSTDMWANMEVDLTNAHEDTFEDSVILTLDDQRYEILPQSKTRVKVRRHYEVPKNLQDPVADPKAWLLINEPGNHPQGFVQTKAPHTKTAAQNAGKLTREIQRTTNDPEFWARVEAARRPLQEITVKLPRGVELHWSQRRRLRKVIKGIARGKPIDDVTVNL